MSQSKQAGKSAIDGRAEFFHLSLSSSSTKNFNLSLRKTKKFSDIYVTCNISIVKPRNFKEPTKDENFAGSNWEINAYDREKQDLGVG